MIPPLPQVKDLVLVGGGHAHVHVLKAFAMRPVHGLRITLISREADTPYSGMLPGHVHGAYDVGDVHINLLRLARAAGARLFTEEVTGLDLTQRRVRFGAGRELRFDRLSINTGAAPNCPFQQPNVVPVKPIGRFLPDWQALKRTLGANAPLVVVGGGAGGFEISVAARQALGGATPISLVTSGVLLPEHNARVQTLARDALQEKGVALREHFRVADIGDQAVVSDSGDTLAAQGVLWVTGVSAPAWLKETGLELDKQGYLAIDTQLRSRSHPFVFAGGDAASMVDQPRPKAGVFAVRQGPILAANLRADVLEQPGGLQTYKAQRQYLALLNCADQTAIASYGRFAFRHRALWWLKNRIDLAFMRKFNELPDMNSAGAGTQLKADVWRSPDMSEDMRCGGCGSKINATLLDRVLRDVDVVDAPWVQRGIGDDAAVMTVEAGKLVLTTDGFRSMVDDPRLFARIATHHALSDIYAMGAKPTSVLLNATVPLMSDAMMEDELRELITGVSEVLHQGGVPLVGGHSAEGAELAISLSVTGVVADGEPLTKQNAQPGDALVLTKGLGSGCILAASMRGECAAQTLEGCLRALDASNDRAADILRAHGATACTDVTGFGLAGHLLEMTQAPGANVGARVNLAEVPLMDGALSVIRQGVRSSLHQANEQALTAYDWDERFGANESGNESAREALALLADPQTAGGLLAAVPATEARECVQQLQAAGLAQAAVIGTFTGDGRLSIH